MNALCVAIAAVVLFTCTAEAGWNPKYPRRCTGKEDCAACLTCRCCKKCNEPSGKSCGVKQARVKAGKRTIWR